jgi:hypothetical protein
VNKTSIIVDATDTNDLDAVTGTDGDSFSLVRGAAGGPPLLGVDDIEIGQVWLTDDGSAVIKGTEIKQVPGLHMELASYPLWSVDYLNGKITFVAALPLSHTGPVPKRTYVEYYTPVLVALPHVSDFKFPEETHAIASVQDYDGATASSSKSLNQGSFKAKLQDGLTDLVVAHKNQNLWWEFYPDRNQAQHGSMQGILGVSRIFPAGALLEADCTISAETTAVEVL